MTALLTIFAVICMGVCFLLGGAALEMADEGDSRGFFKALIGGAVFGALALILMARAW